MHFQLGKIVATQGVRQKFSTQQMSECLNRHKNGDWGDLDEQDMETNNKSVRLKGMILSNYKFPAGSMYIITDPGHQVTTILLPEEY